MFVSPSGLSLSCHAMQHFHTIVLDGVPMLSDAEGSPGPPRVAEAGGGVVGAGGMRTERAHISRHARPSPPRRCAVPPAAGHNEARRCITLIDQIYEARRTCRTVEQRFFFAIARKPTHPAAHLLL